MPIYTKEGSSTLWKGGHLCFLQMKGIMEDKRLQQLDVLRTMYDYNKKLRTGITEVVEEIRTERKEDTQEYLEIVLKGLNWVIQVVNGTKDLLNEKEIIIDKDIINADVMELNQAYMKKDELAIADLLEKSFLPMLDVLDKAAVELADIQEN